MFKQYFISLLVFTLHNVAESAKDYGSFKLHITRFDLCKGPKHKDCAFLKVNITNGVFLNFDITVTENVSPTKGKIVAISKGKQLVRLQMTKPCDHLFLRPLIESFLNVTQNCVILKGHYKYVIDIEKIAQKYYGGMFLYGNMTFYSVFYGNDCNFSCANIYVTLTPKNQNQ